MDISAATTLQTASVLWDQGETISSIRMLQGLENTKLDVIRQDISVGRAELLATLVSTVVNSNNCRFLLIWVGSLDFRSETRETRDYYD